MSTIKTKVARIDSNTTVVLAAGSEAGVREGMEFIIYQLGETISDPESGQPLGSIEHVKTRVVVRHVQETLCIASTKSRTVTRLSPFELLEFHKLSQLSGPTKETVQDTFATDAQPAHATFDPKVRIGDHARSVESG